MTLDKEECKKLLKEKGLKVTSQRLSVLWALASCPEAHLTAEEIYKMIQTDCPQIGLATVYRNLQQLLEFDLINRINLDDGFVRYEIGQADKDGAKHHHLICRSCGKVISFRENPLEGLEENIKETTGFEVIDYEVKLYGFCKECGGKTD